MGKQFKKKITWVIKNFASLQCEKIYSDQFVVDGCKWRFLAYPKGYKVDNYLSVFLEVANHESLPLGWKRHAKFSITMLNQHSENLSQQKDLQEWFDQKAFNWGMNSMFSLNEIHAKDSGFLINGELKIVGEVDVLEAIGKLNVSDEVSTILETIDVHEFQLLPSQAKSVILLFDRHSEFASEFSPKTPNLRTGYMSLLLSLIETMCQSPQNLSNDYLSEAYTVLGFMTSAGFKLDWLEKKLDKLLEKKERNQVGDTRVHEMEEELKDLKDKCSDIEALIEKEKAEVSAAKAPFSFDDVV